MIKNILIVDSDKDVLSIIADIFKNRGYKVFCAIDHLKVLSTLKQERIDIVISDLRIPIVSELILLNFVQMMDLKPDFYFMTCEDEENFAELYPLGVKNIFQKQLGFSNFIAKIEKEFPINK